MNYKKILALGLSLTFLSLTPIYAATNLSETVAESEMPVLTLADAIQSALSNSNKLTLNSQQNEVLTEQLRYSNDLSSLTYLNLYTSKQQNEQQRQFLQDQITNDVTTRYNNIVLLEDEIENLKKDIELKVLELNILEAQAKLGLVTAIQLEAAELEIDSLKMNLSAKEETLRSEQSGFKLVTNRSLDKYVLEDTIELKPFRITGSIEGYFKGKVDTYLKYQKEFIKLQDDFFFDQFVNPLTGMTYGPTYAEYLSAKYNLNSSNLTLQDTEKNLVQSLVSSYSSLLTLEDQINTLESQLSFTKKQLELGELQYQLGLQTKLSYLKQCSSLKDLEYSLKTLTNTYNTTAEMLQKPWLMANSLS